MEFLVQIQVDLPAEMPADQRHDLLGREKTKATQLRREGIIKRIWRVPGRLANVGIWEAETPTVLHEALVSLPLFDWMDIQVTALATHYLEVE